MDKIEEVTRNYIIQQVMPNHLNVEKSIRSLPYWEVCRDCKGFCCTNTSGLGRNVNSLFNEFDKEVIAVTFPNYISYSEKAEIRQYPNSSNDPRFNYCAFNSDTGCIIPEGRPSICTAHLCNKKYEMDKQNIPHQIKYEVIQKHHYVSRALSGLLPPTTFKSKMDRWDEKQHMKNHYNVDNPQIEDRIVYINSVFEESKEIINSHDDFKVKFNFKPITMPNNI